MEAEAGALRCIVLGLVSSLSRLLDPNASAVCCFFFVSTPFYASTSGSVALGSPQAKESAGLPACTRVSLTCEWTCSPVGDSRAQERQQNRWIAEDRIASQMIIHRAAWRAPRCPVVMIRRGGEAAGCLHGSLCLFSP